MLFKDILSFTEGSRLNHPLKSGTMLKIKSLVFGFFIIVIWIFSYSGVYGTDWKFLQTNFQGEFSYDAENITHSSGNIVGVSLKIVYSEKFKKEEGLDHLSETVGLWEINCQEKKMYLLSTSHTSKEGEIWPPQVWLPPRMEIYFPRYNNGYFI